MQNKLHIISFDVPYPDDYGGVIDVFHTIKSLADAGVEIYLHCFQYNRQEADILRKYCKQVWYYSRKTGLQGISLRLPYIVYSRRSKTLLHRLQETDAPILFEGVHSTYYLNHATLSGRLKIVRNQNVEHHYYAALAQRAITVFSKVFFSLEAQRLKRYEHRLQAADIFLSVSVADNDFFTNAYPDAINLFLPSFHPYSKVMTKPGKGTFCLYHGNLGHPENREAVLFLLNEVFPFIDMPVIIAGRKPGADIIAACERLPNCKLIANPGDAEMEQLITDAHIHLLPTFQPTGLKLKLLYALFRGRHVLLNEDMLHGNGLDKCCVVANTAPEMIAQVERLKGLPFTDTDIAQRTESLATNYNNKINAEKIIRLLQH